jgi:hypothetical protein
MTVVKSAQGKRSNSRRASGSREKDVGRRPRGVTLRTVVDILGVEGSFVAYAPQDDAAAGNADYFLGIRVPKLSA